MTVTWSHGGAVLPREAPDAEAAITVYRETHGVLADHSYPVVEGH